MCLLAVLPLILTFPFALPVAAEDKDCKTGDVTLDTAGKVQSLSLLVHK